MEWKVMADGLRVEETKTGFSIVPAERPAIDFPSDMFVLKYNHVKKGWMVEAIEEAVKKFFDMPQDDFSIRELKEPISFGSQKLIGLPNLFRLIQVGEGKKPVIQPAWAWWMTGGGELPEIKLEAGIVPVIDFSGSIYIVSEEEVKTLA